MGTWNMIVSAGQSGHRPLIFVYNLVVSYWKGKEAGHGDGSAGLSGLRQKGMAPRA